MFEKVNPSHPDKIADRIAGAIVDLAYKTQHDPKIAVEVLIGHGKCYIITESSVRFMPDEITSIVNRIVNDRGVEVELVQNRQDIYLSTNQEHGIKCGDNGIFRGMPITDEQRILSHIVKELYDIYPTDGKYILSVDQRELIACQSGVYSRAFYEELTQIYYNNCIVNPLGDWTGGTNVDCGATNRKLGSDMGDAVTGGGLHGKDLSKADVSVNIYAHLKAQKYDKPVEIYCAIGDETVDGKPYSEIVKIARTYIKYIGGFEKLAEWGLIR